MQLSKAKEEAMIYKTLLKEQKTEQQKSRKNWGMNPSAFEG